MVKHGGGSIRGCFSPPQKGFSVKVEGIMKASKYMQVSFGVKPSGVCSKAQSEGEIDLLVQHQSKIYI